MADEITLGYWDLRGLAEPIRLLLHYKKVKFVDKRYDTIKDFRKWRNEKFNLELDFPNLPYYMEGDTKLTQSTTILRHLAQKYKLDGKDCKQKLTVSLMEQQLIDTKLMFVLYALGKSPETTGEEFLKKVPDHMRLYEKFLEDKEFLTGDTITYVDFMASEIFDFYRLFEKTVFDDFPILKTYHQRIKNLSELQDYLQSPTYKRWPIFGPFFKFGGGGDEPEHA